MPFLEMVRGQYYLAGFGTVNTTMTATNQRLYAIPAHLSREIVVDALAVGVSVGGAGSAVRLGIYDTVGGIPGNLVVDVGTVATTSSGVKTVGVSPAVRLSSGTYWLAIAQQGGTSPVLVSHTNALFSELPEGIWTYYESGVSGALPSTFTITAGSFDIPQFYYRFAGVVLESAAALTGTGSLRAGSQDTAAITAAGSLAAIGVSIRSASAALTGTGTVAAAAPSAPAVTHLRTGSDTTDASSYTTQSFTPTANRLVLALVHSRLGGGPAAPTLTGNGLTWVQVATQTGGDFRATLFRAMKPSPTAGTVTIDFGGVTQADAAWSICELSGVDTGGTNGSGAIVQSATATDSNVGSLTVTLAAFADSDNVTFGGFGLGNGRTTVAGTGFTTISSLLTQGASTVHTEWKASNDTTVDLTATVSPNVFNGIAIEIKAA